MINTVLGPIPIKELGTVLMHEHILIDWKDTSDNAKSYSVTQILDVLLPYLIDVQNNRWS